MNNVVAIMTICIGLDWIEMDLEWVWAGGWGASLA